MLNNRVWYQMWNKCITFANIPSDIVLPLDIFWSYNSGGESIFDSVAQLVISCSCIFPLKNWISLCQNTCTLSSIPPTQNTSIESTRFCKTMVSWHYRWVPVGHFAVITCRKRASTSCGNWIQITPTTDPFHWSAMKSQWSLRWAPSAIKTTVP